MLIILFIIIFFFTHCVRKKPKTVYARNSSCVLSLNLLLGVGAGLGRLGMAGNISLLSSSCESSRKEV